MAATSSWLVTSFLLLVLTFEHQLVTPVEGRFGSQYRTLFTNSWPVNTIYSGNWSSTVYGSETAWAMNLYLSWCGHCQRFAPMWKRVALELKDWRGAIQFGALACSHPEGEAVCVKKGLVNYPTLMFYPPNAADSYSGFLFTDNPTDANLRMGIVDFISWNVTNPSRSFPDLQPIISLIELFDVAASAGGRHVMLIAENVTDVKSEENYLGAYVILDVSGLKDALVVRRVDGTVAEKLGISEFPSLHIVNPANGNITMLVSLVDRRGFVAAIKGRFPHEDEERPPPMGGAPSPTPPRGAIRLPDGVHVVDLESGVYYSLLHEVRMQKEFGILELRSLMNYVDYMAKLLPVRRPVKRWLERVSEWLGYRVAPVNSSDWMIILNSLEDESAYIPRHVKWIGCRSDDPAKRGYPCSLWTIFHTLTVSAYAQPSEFITPKDVILNMRAYIQHFFTCTECRNNFLELSANVNDEIPNKSPYEGLLWLWSAHNRVNLRLHGDPTEDPVNPKMQFPTYTKCPNCHQHQPGSQYVQSMWNDVEVRQYLLRYYAAENVIQDAEPGGQMAESVHDASTGRAITPSTCILFVVVAGLVWLSR